MNKDNTPFEFLDSNELNAIKTTQQEQQQQQYKTICGSCKNIMVRKVFDGIIDIVTIIECPYSNSINIQEHPVLECSHLKTS